MSSLNFLALGIVSSCLRHIYLTIYGTNDEGGDHTRTYHNSLHLSALRCAPLWNRDISQNVVTFWRGFKKLFWAWKTQRHLYCKVYSWIVFLIVLDKVLPSKCLASQDTPTGEHPISRHSKPPSKAVAFSSAVSSGSYHQSSLQKLPFCLIRLLNTDLRWDYMEAPPHSCLSW